MRKSRFTDGQIIAVLSRQHNGIAGDDRSGSSSAFEEAAGHTRYPITMLQLAVPGHIRASVAKCRRLELENHFFQP
jgi:hypothetical protein